MSNWVDAETCFPHAQELGTTYKQKLELHICVYGEEANLPGPAGSRVPEQCGWLRWNREVKMLKMTDEDGEVEKDMTHRGPYVP